MCVSVCVCVCVCVCFVDLVVCLFSISWISYAFSFPQSKPPLALCESASLSSELLLCVCVHMYVDA